MIERLPNYPYPYGNDWKEYAKLLYAALTEESKDRVIDLLGLPALDEDAMGSDSPTRVATQQSIKAYVDDAVIAGGIVSAPPSGEYKVKEIRLNASKHLVIVYDEDPIP